MKVCDKCSKKLLTKGTTFNLLEEDYEICDECVSKIVRWIKEPIKQGFLQRLISK